MRHNLINIKNDLFSGYRRNGLALSYLSSTTKATTKEKACNHLRWDLPKSQNLMFLLSDEGTHLLMHGKSTCTYSNDKTSTKTPEAYLRSAEKYENRSTYGGIIIRN